MWRTNDTHTAARTGELFLRGLACVGDLVSSNKHGGRRKQGQAVSDSGSSVGCCWR